jgi:hypothetical protein
MAEEQEESTGKSFKNIIIGLVSTVTLGIGGFITNKLTGGDDEKPAVQQAAPVINIQNNQTQTAGGGGKTVIINKGGDGKAAPAPKPKKKEGDEFKEEAPKW